MQNDFVNIQNSLDKQIVDTMKFFKPGYDYTDKEIEL